MVIDSRTLQATPSAICWRLDVTSANENDRTEVDRLIAAEVRFGLTLANAGYGASAAFRQGLSERRLAWAVGIPRNQKVYGATSKWSRPRAASGAQCWTRSPERQKAVPADLA